MEKSIKDKIATEGTEFKISADKEDGLVTLRFEHESGTTIVALTPENALQLALFIVKTARGI